MLKKIPNPVLGLLFILLYHFSWAPYKQAYLIFFAFIPMFALLDRFSAEKLSIRKVLFRLFILFFATGLLQHYWVSNAHPAGTILAAFVQTLLLIFPAIFYYKYTLNGYKKQGFLSFVLLTISIQYLQNFWDLAWPWFNLGNSLSEYPKLIQWYQYTGGIGGSLLILIVNIFLFNITSNKTKYTSNIIKVSISITAFFIFIKITKPINYTNSLKVLINQPNLDAYNEKFNTSQNTQVEDFIKNIEHLDSSETTLIVCPETFIHRSIKEENVQSNPYLNLIQNRLKSDNHYVVLGANTRKKVNPKNEKDKASIRHHSGVFYKVYNSAVFFNKNTTFDIYNKSKLVAGAETTPFASVLTPLVENIFDFDLGGVSGNLGKSDKSKNFKTEDFVFSPLICFESVFGDHVASFTEQGSGFITIITNDDWWGNTSGYKHHFELAKIRAIENQKYVVRSANTGISGIINGNGEVVKSLGYKERGIIEGTIFLNPQPTYFARNKHLIGKLSTFVLIMLLLQMETLLIRTKKRR